MDKIVFLLFVLPFLILSEGYQMFKKDLKSKEFWVKVPYILLIALFALLVVLWFEGYRF